MATYALLATFSYLVPKDVTCHNQTIWNNWSFCNFSENKSSSSDTTDGGSDDLPSEDANTPSMNSEKRKREKTRKYSENYLKFAFTYKETDGEELCVVCSSVLSNETMKPSKPQRHSKTTHGHLKEFFFYIPRLKSFEGQQTLMRQSAKVSLRPNSHTYLRKV